VVSSYFYNRLKRLSQFCVSFWAGTRDWEMDKRDTLSRDERERERRHTVHSYTGRSYCEGLSVLRSKHKETEIDYEILWECECEWEIEILWVWVWVWVWDQRLRYCECEWEIEILWVWVRDQRLRYCECEWGIRDWEKENRCLRRSRLREDEGSTHHIRFLNFWV
jgi:hypothetical protein